MKEAIERHHKLQASKRRMFNNHKEMLESIGSKQMNKYQYSLLDE